VVAHSGASVSHLPMISVMSVVEPPAGTDHDGMSEAIFALVGVALGSLTTVAIELMRSRAESRREVREALRVAAATFTTTLAQIDLQSSAVREPDRREAALARLPDLQVQARGQYETLRLLLTQESTQRAARLVLRHSWAMWRQAETGEDPRGHEYSEDPWTRYHRELRQLLIGVRTELGIENASDVYAEPVR
jgi:non-ribosomal peptide synthetase component F